MFPAHDNVEWSNTEEIPPFTEEKVKEAAQKMKNRKSSGVDGIASGQNSRSSDERPKQLVNRGDIPYEMETNEASVNRKAETFRKY